MADPTGVALLGAGYWGRRLARVLEEHGDCALRVVCDLDPHRARDLARHSSAAVTTDTLTAMADATVEAVVIATPSATHEGLVREALDAGCHVLVEKPLAGSSARASALGERADARGRVLLCDQTYRFAPATAAVRRLVTDPSFGPLRAVESTRTNHGHSQPDLDVFWDLAYHDLAILDAVVPGGLCGTFEVRATAHDAAQVGRAHRGRLALTPLDGCGPTASITVDWHAASKVRSMRFAGADHAVTWDDVDVDGPRVEHDGSPVAVACGEPLVAVVQELLTAVAERRPASCGPAQEGPILAVLEAASASAAHDGAPVVVELVAESRVDVAS